MRSVGSGGCAAGIIWRRGEDLGNAGLDLIRWWYVPAGALAASAYEYVDRGDLRAGHPRFGWAVELNGDPGVELRAGYAPSIEQAKKRALEATRRLLEQSLARVR